MKCQHCDCELEGGRGAYIVRCEASAVGGDVSLTENASDDQETSLRMLFTQLEEMSAEEVERDVYQLWEAVLCRECRKELGAMLGGYLEE